MQYFVLTDIEFVRFNFDYKHASLQVVPFKPDEHDTSGLLSVIEQQKLKSLKQVVFGSDGNAVLDLDFGGVSRLEFFDDSARTIPATSAEKAKNWNTPYRTFSSM